jgi:hypothetical protein
VRVQYYRCRRGLSTYLFAREFNRAFDQLVIEREPLQTPGYSRCVRRGSQERHLRTRFHALTRFARSHTSSISCSAQAGRSGAGFATGGSVPWCPRPGASPRSSGAKASEYWIFCRVPLMSCQSYLPLSIVRAGACPRAGRRPDPWGPRFRLGLSVAPPFSLGVPH